MEINTQQFEGILQDLKQTCQKTARKEAKSTLANSKAQWLET
jgi:hypothetical protein